MKCNNCDCSNPDDAKFCKRCGIYINTNPIINNDLLSSKTIKQPIKEKEEKDGSPWFFPIWFIITIAISVWIAIEIEIDADSFWFFLLSFVVGGVVWKLLEWIGIR